MRATEFTHLHMHSQYSLLDGAIRLKDLFPRLHELKMNTVALTDHGNLFGTLDFYKQAKAQGIKPIFGCETYICADRFDRQNRRNYHLILLAKNEEGFRNLTFLNSMGFLEGFYYHPRIDKKILRDRRNGLIGLSSCLGGELAETLLKNGYEQAKQVALEYKDIFEPGCFYLEIQPNGLEDQEKVNESWRKMSRETGIPLVATGDCHYVQKSDAKAHEVLMAIQLGKTLTDEKRLRHELASYYIKSGEEFSKAFHDMPEALENTVKIANECNFELKLGSTMLPRYHIPTGYDTAGYFRKIAEEGLLKRFEEFQKIGKRFDPDQYRAQLEREIQVIVQMDFPSYFLIVWDFIRYSKEKGIPVGPGRGSGAGSLVAYAMQITDLDPIPYNLLFERFLNPERISMPDFDIDFCMNRRDEVIKYVAEKYGKDRVGQIITFGSLSAKSALKDVGRVMGLPFAELNDLTKNLPNLVEGHPVTMQWAIDNEPKFKQIMTERPQYKEVIEIAQALEGLHRNAGMHAAGIVISDGPLWDYVPCSRGQNGEIVTQYAKDEVEEAGLVKFDFLGLKTLTVIDGAVSMIQAENPSFDLKTIPLDDANVYKMVADGNTVGVFQMESSGFTDLVKRLRPDRFEDIIAAGALYRPGPLEGGMVDDFINRKHGRTKIAYHHPAMEPILKETYGVIVYQEQVMQIARALAGYSLGGADLLRRAMGKKKKEVMEKEKENFVKGAQKVGISSHLAAEVFDLMAAFAGYGFNKSHSAAYGLLTYQTAYLKYHFPHEFMASLLTCDKDDIDKVVKNIEEANAMGLEVLRPDVNQSDMNFSVVRLQNTEHLNAQNINEKKSLQKPPVKGIKDSGTPETKKVIRFGLSAIRGVGESAVEALLEARKQDGAFRSLFSFSEQVDLRRVNKKALDSLIKAGALDDIIPSRAQALAMMEASIERAQKLQREKESGQTSLFGLLSESSSQSSKEPEPSYPTLEEFPLRQKLAFEKEALGFYMSGHPMDRYQKDLARAQAQRLDKIESFADRTEMIIGGVVTDYRERPLKSGNGRMAFFYLEDSHGSIEVVCFSKAFAEAESLLKSDEPLLLTGTLVTEGEGESQQKKLHLKEARLLSEWRLQKTSQLVIDCSAEEMTKEKAVCIQQVLKKYPGGVPTLLRIRKPGQWIFDAELPLHYRVLPSEDLLQALEKVCGAEAVELK